MKSTPNQLIDRIGRALLIEPMTREELALMLHESLKPVCRELSHLIDSRHVTTHQCQFKPVYCLTRRGRDWAEAGLQGPKFHVEHEH